MDIDAQKHVLRSFLEIDHLDLKYVEKADFGDFGKGIDGVSAYLDYLNSNPDSARSRLIEILDSENRIKTA